MARRPSAFMFVDAANEEQLFTIAADLARAFRALRVQVPPNAVYKMAELVVVSTSGAHRTFHTMQHLLDGLPEDVEKRPLSFIAAIFQDIVQLRAEGGIPPYLLPFLHRAQAFPLPRQSDVDKDMRRSRSATPVYGRPVTERGSLSARGCNGGTTLLTRQHRSSSDVSFDVVVQRLVSRPQLLPHQGRLQHRRNALSSPEHVLLMAGVDMRLDRQAEWAPLIKRPHTPPPQQQSRKHARDRGPGVAGTSSPARRDSGSATALTGGNSSATSTCTASSGWFSNGSGDAFARGQHVAGPREPSTSTTTTIIDSRRSSLETSAGRLPVVSTLVRALSWWSNGIRLDHDDDSGNDGDHATASDEPRQHTKAPMASWPSVSSTRARRAVAQRICYTVFGREVGDTLAFDTSAPGLSEFLSCVVAMDVLAPWLNEAQLLHVCACIQASIPFQRPEAKMRLLDNCTRVLADELPHFEGIPRTFLAQHASQVVRSACRMAERGVAHYTAKDTRVFLAAVWRALPEQHAALRYPESYTLDDWVAALAALVRGFELLTDEPLRILPHFPSTRSPHHRLRTPARAPPAATLTSTPPTTPPVPTAAVGTGGATTAAVAASVSTTRPSRPGSKANATNATPNITGNDRGGRKGSKKGTSACAHATARRATASPAHRHASGDGDDSDGGGDADESLRESLLRANTNLERGRAYVAARLVTACVMHAVLCDAGFVLDETPVRVILPGGLGGHLPQPDTATGGDGDGGDCSGGIGRSDRAAPATSHSRASSHNSTRYHRGVSCGTRTPVNRLSDAEEEHVRARTGHGGGVERGDAHGSGEEVWCADDTWETNDCVVRLLQYGFEDSCLDGRDKTACEASLCLFRMMVGGGGARGGHPSSFERCVQLSLSYARKRLDAQLYLRCLPLSVVTFVGTRILHRALTDGNMWMY
ncbi:hypothetical protein PTSG_08795 [Salpingoeca rosetta]|uniref:Uncharacterized protein n=1 Tax=Salpingoeca rosetta (strain ATCC 50818 / BSB-021) TaxID=946362 RepID=F2UKQ4_SALR5|nr:uncharacterized protein PTSG_08795 [Salpingoeca rosetta]EGD77703.1 hypothetical protein PTSG_08795 [Salpingoeca rosetta]|eukprot:XP_004990179.1 hypothetical protein PTSG_08795 [Salpingoeca rosetta]